MSTINKDFIDKKYLKKFWSDKVLKAPTNVAYEELTTEKKTLIGAINELTESDVRLPYDVDDAARKILGSDWRMPTAEEMLELVSECDHLFTNHNGVDGIQFINKHDANLSIFLPVCGYKEDDALEDEVDLFYWSSTIGGVGYSRFLYASPYYSQIMVTNNDCYDGLNIRPVSMTSTDAVDLGLTSGVKWAKYNLTANGFTDVESDCGDFFAWGETQPKTSYEESNYAFREGVANKYIDWSSDDYTIKKDTLSNNDTISAKAYYDKKGNLVKLVDTDGNVVTPPLLSTYTEGFGIKIDSNKKIDSEVEYEGSWTNEWSDLPSMPYVRNYLVGGNMVWTDGEDTYMQDETGYYDFILNKATMTWETLTWNGSVTHLKHIHAYHWTDGENIYYTTTTSNGSGPEYSQKNKVYVLNPKTKTWQLAPSSLELESLNGENIIHINGETYFFQFQSSNSSAIYRLDKTNMTWVNTGKTSPVGFCCRTYFIFLGDNIYLRPSIWENETRTYQFNPDTLQFTALSKNILHTFRTWTVGDVVYTAKHKWENGTVSDVTWNIDLTSDNDVCKIGNDYYYMHPKYNGNTNNVIGLDSYKLNQTTLEWEEVKFYGLYVPLQYLTSSSLFEFDGEIYYRDWVWLLQKKVFLKYSKKENMFVEIENFTDIFPLNFTSVFNLGNQFFGVVSDESSINSSLYVYNASTKEFDYIDNKLLYSMLFQGCTWTDGEVYYLHIPDDETAYELSGSDWKWDGNSWKTVNWNITLANVNAIWHDYEGRTYYSNPDESTTYLLTDGQWVETTMNNGLADMNGSYVWDNGEQIFYANTHVLKGSTWEPMTWQNIATYFDETSIYTNTDRTIIFNFGASPQYQPQQLKHETIYKSRHNDNLQTELTQGFGVSLVDNTIEAEVEYRGESHTLWKEMSWAFPSDIDFRGEYVWDNGLIYHFTYEGTTFILNPETHEWENIAWNDQSFIPQDGRRIKHVNNETLYFDTNAVYVRTKFTNFWGALVTYDDVTYPSLPWILDDNVYMMHNKTIYQWSDSNWSESSQQLEFDFLLSDDFSGENIWNDGFRYYFSNNGVNYTFNPDTDTWEQCVINGITTFNGSDVWKQGASTYLSISANHYLWDSNTLTWVPFFWEGNIDFYGQHIWTDGVYTYYSFNTQQFKLNNTHTYATKHGDILQEKLIAGAGINIKGNVISSESSKLFISQMNIENNKRVYEICANDHLRCDDVIEVRGTLYIHRPIWSWDPNNKTFMFHDLGQYVNTTLNPDGTLGMILN